VTIADLVADRRALTPSEAGELCVPDAREVRAALDSYRDRLALAGTARLARARADLDAIRDRLGRASGRDLDRRRERLGRLAAALEALSPLAVLARGYSLTTRADGTPLRAAAAARPGDLVRTKLGDGEFTSRVEAPGPAPARPPRKPRPRTGQ